jgi:hypothetical protein
LTSSHFSGTITGKVMQERGRTVLYAEFKTKSDDGLIKIPEEYVAFNAKPLKVILIVDEEMQESDELDSIFKEFNLDMSNYTFNRDEAHER